MRAGQHFLFVVEAADSNFVQHYVFVVGVPDVDLIAVAGLAKAELAIETEFEKRECGTELMKNASSPLAVLEF